MKRVKQPGCIRRFRGWTLIDSGGWNGKPPYFGITGTSRSVDLQNSIDEEGNRQGQNPPSNKDQKNQRPSAKSADEKFLDH